MSTSEAIRYVNAAATRTGNEPITSFDEGSAESIVAANNYELIVEEELSSFPYSWAKTDKDLNRLEATPIDGWAYVFQLPPDLIKIIRCHVNGVSVPYKRKGDKVYTDEEYTTLEYTYRVEEEEWSADFREKIITRMEALFLRALSEDYDKAEAREDRSEDKGKIVKSQDSQNQTPKDRRPASRLVTCRRA